MKTLVHISLSHPPNTCWRATSLHLLVLDAMAPFIHLSLLLATIQLPLVSATPVTVCLPEGSNVTFKFPPDGTATPSYNNDKCECISGECMGSKLHGLTVSNRETVTIKNLTAEHSGNYLCCNSCPNTQTGCWCLYVNVTKGQQQKEKDATTVADCRKLCRENPTCQYFTFKTETKCFLMSPCDNMVIKLNTDTISGYSLRICCSDTNGLQFLEEAKSWIDALEHCRNQNSYLVQITNQTVQDAVNRLLQNKTDKMQRGVWIGLERSIFGRNDDPWMWTSGSKAELPQWNSSSPVDSLNNHCGKIIWVERSNFKWLDADCHDELPFICQDPT